MIFWTAWSGPVWGAPVSGCAGKVTFGACHISLTDRELDILRLVCQNLSYQEIADALQISKRTVSFHISNMLSKTGHKRLIGLAVEATDKGYAPSRQK